MSRGRTMFTAAKEIKIYLCYETIAHLFDASEHSLRGGFACMYTIHFVHSQYSFTISF